MAAVLLKVLLLVTVLQIFHANALNVIYDDDDNVDETSDEQLNLPEEYESLEDGYLPHEQRCDLFYVLEGRDVMLLTCPKRQLYDESIQKCAKAEHVNCGLRLKPKGSRDDSSEESSDEKPIKFKCPSKKGYYPHKHYCHLFFNCQKPKKSASLQQCPIGALFDIRHLTCRQRHLVDCGSRIDPREKENEDVDNAVAIGWKPIKCPHRMGIFPHPTDCDKFVRCWMSYPYIDQCPYGFLYDDTWKRCLHHSVVECKNGENPYAKDTTTTTTTKKTTTTKTTTTTTVTTPTTTSTTEAPTTTTTTSVATTTEDDDEDKIIDRDPKYKCDKSHGKFTHEKYCHWYYNCQDKKATLKECSRGRYYDSKRQECRPPKDVSCEGRIKPDDFKCPKDGKFPHERNCRQYYLCKKGSYQVHQCPHRKLYNVDRATCEDEQRVTCGDRIHPDDDPDEPEDKVIDPKPDFTCEERYGRYKDEKNCDYYYHCKDKVASLRECRRGRYYDYRRRKCLDSWEVDCEDREKPEDREKRTSTTQPTTTTERPTPAPFVCPSKDGKYPDERDCSVYHDCKKGKVKTHQCSKGYLYHIKKKKCQDEEDVECESRIHPDDDPYGEQDKIVDPDPKFVCKEAHGKFSHEQFCDWYMNCKDKKPTTRECKKGKFYDITKRKCRDFNKVDCKDRKKPEERETTTTSTIVITTASTVGTTSTTSSSISTVTAVPTDAESQSTSSVITTSSSVGSSSVPTVSETSSQSTTYPSTRSTKIGGSTVTKTSTGTVSHPGTKSTPSVGPSESVTESTTTEAPSSTYGTRTTSKIGSTKGTGSTPTSGSSSTGTTSNMGSTKGTASTPTSSGTSGTGTTSNIGSTKGTASTTITSSGSSGTDTTSNIGSTKGTASTPTGLPDISSTSSITSSKNTGSTQYMSSTITSNSDDSSTPSSTHEDLGSTTPPDIVIDPSICNETDGNIPHHKDCSLFYSCEDGTPNLLKCPDGTLFHSVMKLCYREDWVNCEDRNRPILKSTTVVDHTTTELPIKDLCAIEDGHFHHPTDCKMFYSCKDGFEELKECPDGTLFDNALRECYDEDHVNCGDRQRPTTTIHPCELWLKTSSTATPPLTQTPTSITSEGVPETTKPGTDSTENTSSTKVTRNDDSAESTASNTVTDNIGSSSSGNGEGDNTGSTSSDNGEGDNTSSTSSGNGEGDNTSSTSSGNGDGDNTGSTSSGNGEGDNTSSTSSGNGEGDNTGSTSSGNGEGDNASSTSSGNGEGDNTGSTSSGNGEGDNTSSTSSGNGEGDNTGSTSSGNGEGDNTSSTSSGNGDGDNTGSTSSGNGDGDNTGSTSSGNGEGDNTSSTSSGNGEGDNTGSTSSGNGEGDNTGSTSSGNGEGDNTSSTSSGNGEGDNTISTSSGNGEGDNTSSTSSGNGEGDNTSNTTLDSSSTTVVTDSESESTSDSSGNQTSTDAGTSSTEPNTGHPCLTYTRTTHSPQETPHHHCDKHDLDCIISETGDVEKWFKCPQEFGIFPHPSSNMLFIHCSNNVPSAKKCGEGLVFSSEYLLCILPEADH